MKRQLSLLILFLVSLGWYCCVQNEPFTDAKSNESVAEGNELVFSGEVKAIRRRKLSVNEMSVVLDSDTSRLNEALQLAPCGKLVIGLNQKQQLLLKHLAIEGRIDLINLLQAYPTVFESQIKNLKRNAFGGTFLVPIYGGRNKIGAFFNIQQRKVSSIEVIYAEF